MTLKLILACTALALAPSLSMAMGCSDHGDKTAMTCADGMVVDVATGTCVPRTTS